MPLLKTIAMKKPKQTTKKVTRKASHAGPAEKKQKTEAEIWDELFKDTDRRKISQAYYEACQLDDRGEHEAADRFLLAAGETREIVEQRRRNLDRKAKNPTNVT
jgi:hypothetical protein